MENYICINGNRIPLSNELSKIAQKLLGISPGVKLSEIPEGETFKIGRYEFVVLYQAIDGTAVILKDPNPLDVKFGESNNYDGSAVDEACNKFAESLSSMIGEENIFTHEVDLTSNDGLDDYGHVTRRASLLTAEQYRRYVPILDQHKPDRWWWLATPWSTETHGHSSAALCVSPRGGILSNRYYYDYGVRPFCILSSNIFVSK